MGVFTFTMADITSAIAPARLFQAFSMDNQNFLPKVVPDFIASVEFVQGDSTTVGCIKKVNFGPEATPFTYVKNRVDEIDEGNFYLKYTTIEGDVLLDTLECAVYENRYEPSGNGSRYTLVATYHTKGDHVVKDEELEDARESIKKMFKAVEEHLIANSQLYA